jgi:microcin C transport system substrate-binding protein
VATAAVFGAALLGIAPGAQALELADIPWETNNDDPTIGDPNAKKGGTLYQFSESYPLTWRLVGPNANDGFATWRRAFTMDFGLVTRHPNTDNWIPMLASHWYVEDDHTVYYKIDADARWSDGEPITADDYVFTLDMMRDKNIVDPYYNEYFATMYESIEKLDTHVIKITGKQSSWRPLADFNLFPMPKHQHEIDPAKQTDEDPHAVDPEWVDQMNNVQPLSIGPYTVSDDVTGQYVVYSRDPNWWGKDKHYWKGMWNVDKIHIKCGISTEKALDFFKRGEISSYTVTTAKTWAQDMDFEAIKKGWAKRKRVFVDYPTGMYGFALNLQRPIFQDKNFRKAVQLLFDFDGINEKLMFNAYFRQVSAFTGTEYENPNLKPYGFDPRKAREHLAKAGFTKRGKDGILVNAKGERAAFTLTYGSKGLERHLTVQKETFKRFGVDMSLRLLERATSFARGLEREYEMLVMGRTTGFYPSPHQYFHSVFLETTNNNNIWGFGSPETDKLIDTYRFDLDKSKRLAAMHELDRILQDEAFYVPFWFGPYIRFIYWDHVQWPADFIPKRTQQLTDFMVFWIDTEREAKLKDAMDNGTSLGEDAVVDVDPHGVRARIEGALMGQTEGDSGEKM